MKIPKLTGMFARREPVYRTIKLYCVGDDQTKIDRAGLVDALLAMFENLFRSVPRSYDIHGPYGIRKGSTVGLNAFKSKLEKIGHEKYYSLNGETEGLFGFTLSLGARLENITYSELIVWFAPENFDVDFFSLVRPIATPFSLTTGFCIDIGKNYSLTTESKISRGIFGGATVKMSYDHLNWLATIGEGNVRDIFRHNIFNEAQAKRLQDICTRGKKLTDGLSIIDFADEDELREKRAQLMA